MMSSISMSLVSIPRLRMPAHALEDEVGEERDGVEYLQAAEPLRNLPLSTVRENAYVCPWL